MAGSSSRRYLRPGPAWGACLERIGDAERLGAALSGLLEGIKENAEVYPVLVERGQVRQGKTKAVQVRDELVPALAVYFRIIDKNVVELLFIEQDLSSFEF